MVKVFYMDEKVREGNIAEENVKKHFLKFIKPIADKYFEQKSYYYGLNKEHTKKQRDGINGTFSFKLKYDVKVNQFWSDDKKLILLELYHKGINFDNEWDGWFIDTTLKFDVIIWLWWAKNCKEYLFDSGYFLFLNNMRKWVLENDIIDKYPLKPNSGFSEDKETGKRWDTYNLHIPPSDFPDNCILPVNKISFEKPFQDDYFKKFFEKDKEV